MYINKTIEEHNKSVCLDEPYMMVNIKKNIPDDLISILLKMLNKKNNLRPSLSEILNAINPYI